MNGGANVENAMGTNHCQWCGDVAMAMSERIECDLTAAFPQLCRFPFLCLTHPMIHSYVSHTDGTRICGRVGAGL